MKIEPRVRKTAAVFGILFCLQAGVRADEEADRAALRLIRTNYMEAANSGDLSKIAPFLSKDVTGVMVTGDEVEGLDGLKAYWKRIQDLIGPGGNYHVNVNVDRTDLFGDVELSRGNTEEAVHVGNGKELRFGSYWTAVCRKEAAGWRVLRMQATINPVDNVFTSLRLQKAKLTYGLGGFVCGVILTLIMCSLGRRARPA